MSQSNFKKQTDAITDLPDVGYVGLFFSTDLGTWAFKDETGTVYPLGGGLPTKSGEVAAGSFSGSPLQYAVNFASDFADAGYSISIGGNDARMFNWASRTASGFIINTNSAIALTGPVTWKAVKIGES